LRRHQRFHRRLAPLASPQVERVVFRFLQRAERFQIRQHSLPRLESVEPRVGPGRRGHRAVLVDDFNARQIVPPPRFEIVQIVRRRHLHHAGTEGRVRQIVEDDRDIAVHQRQPHRAPVQLGIRQSFALIATAVSPSMVSGRVVATTTNPPPVPFTGYLMCHKCPGTAACATSRSESAGMAMRAPVHHVLAPVDELLLVQPPNTSRTARDSPASSVNRSRLQSQLAPAAPSDV